MFSHSGFNVDAIIVTQAYALFPPLQGLKRRQAVSAAVAEVGFFLTSYYVNFLLMKVLLTLVY